MLNEILSNLYSAAPSGAPACPPVFDKWKMCATSKLYRVLYSSPDEGNIHSEVILSFFSKLM
eukprot:UN12719